MKKALVLSSLTLLLTACGATTNSVSTTGSSNTVSTQATTTAEQTTPPTSVVPTTVPGTNTNSPSIPKVVQKPLLKKTTYVTFDEVCKYFRCTEARQHKVPGDEGQRLDSPKGYVFLEVDALPKDYLLVEAEGKVYTFQPSTLKITPFTVDSTKKQLTLNKNEALSAKEAFNKKGLFLLTKFKMNESEIDGAGENTTFFNTSATALAFYTYDSTKDSLLAITNATPSNNFLDYTYGGENNKKTTSKGELTTSPFLYDGVHGRIIAWNGINHDFFRGPMGDYPIPSTPIRITTLEGKLIKEFKDGIITDYADEAGNLYLGFYDQINTKDLYAEKPLAQLQKIALLQAGDDTPTLHYYTLSKGVQEYIAKTIDKNSFSYMPLHITIEKNQLIMDSSDKIIFTMEGTTLTRAQLYKKN